MHRLASVFLCLSLLFGLTNQGLGQTAEVTGSVFYRNHRPAVNCSVNLGGRIAIVDVKGRFRLESIAPGKYELQIWCRGRNVKTLKVQIQGSSPRIPSIVI